MSRSDFPPLRVVVERGKLAPASAYDAERIDAYTNGAVLTLSAWQGRNEALQRKYWAIVSKVVKDCKTPWESATECSDALKMAHGVTKIYKSIKMQWHSTPGSLTDLDNTQLTEFYELAMATLSRIVGVDVLTLGRESADTGDRIEHSNSSTITPQAIADEPTNTASDLDSSTTQGATVTNDPYPPLSLKSDQAKTIFTIQLKQSLGLIADPTSTSDLDETNRLLKSFRNIAASDAVTAGCAKDEVETRVKMIAAKAQSILSDGADVSEIRAYLCGVVGLSEEELTQ